MKKGKLIGLLVLSGLIVSGVALAQLVGTQRIVENYWFTSDRAVKFGATPNAEIKYTGGNLLIDVTSGGGKVSMPDGIDTGTAGISLASSLVFEGATADAFETTLSVTDPTADQTFTIPNFAVSAAFLASTLTTNNISAANSIWGVSNALTFEGATADAFETSVTVTDPTADRTVTYPDASGSPILSSGVADAANAVSGTSNGFIFEGATADGFETTLTVADPGSDTTATIPNQTGTFLLSTAAQDAANSIKGVSNGLEFEGATADGFETTLTLADPGADKTVTIPATTGTIAVSGGLTATAGANTACDTTCGAGKCFIGLDAGTTALVACSNAIADTCLCLP